jgi:hypothetical protein
MMRQLLIVGLALLLTGCSSSGRSGLSQSPTDVPALAGAPRWDSLTSYTLWSTTREEDLARTPPAVTAQLSYELRYQAQPLAYLMRIYRGDAPAAEILTVDGNTYVKAGNKWLQTPTAASEPSAPPFMVRQLPPDLWRTARIVGAEKIARVETTHYRTNDAHLAEFMRVAGQAEQPAATQVDYWIADRGGYLKQLALAVTVTANGRPLRRTLVLTIQNENLPQNIVPPPAEQMQEIKRP